MDEHSYPDLTPAEREWIQDMTPGMDESHNPPPAPERTTWNTIPLGKCQCGCGRATTLARQTRPDRGLVKGRPHRFIMGHNRRYLGSPFDERFAGYSTPCWIWQWYIDPTGYGKIGGKWAHRVYFKAFKGEIPSGLEIDHLCRNRPCVNPRHLEAVTRQQNVRRGRATKLTEATARFIRESSLSSRALASELGLSERHIHSIRAGERWADEDVPGVAAAHDECDREAA
jgi:hypothetical protein